MIPRLSYIRKNCSLTQVYSGLLQISEERVQNVSDKLTEGEIVKVKVLEVDKQGRIRLSMKAVVGGE
ncbi:MAG: S1 RNA-binding domain-containing protein [Xanthomonadaceae bacterium]|nr:S1 RNA-binding domain-containing protein [Xanthomonadaceae bacterium]